MTIRTTRLLAALLAAATLAGAQGDPAGGIPGASSRRGLQMTSLGAGRSRVRAPLGSVRPLEADAEGRVRIGRLGFRERWLRRELKERFPGLESVDVVETLEARTTSRGTAATAERYLEILGSDDGARAARDFLADVLAGGRFILIRVSVFVRDGGGGTGLPVVHVVDGATLQARLERARRAGWTALLDDSELRLEAGEGASVRLGESISYVRDYAAFATAGTEVLDPVVDIVPAGIEWRIGGFCLDPSRTVSVGARLLIDEVKRPIDELTGVLGHLRTPVRIQKPIRTRLDWSSDAITLTPPDAGFVVVGIAYPVTDGAAARELEIICRVEVADGPSDDMLGTVRGVDRAARVAFVERRRGPSCKTGQEVVFYRAEKRVGGGVLREVFGDLVSVEVRLGDIEAGDEAR